MIDGWNQTLTELGKRWRDQQSFGAFTVDRANLDRRSSGRTATSAARKMATSLAACGLLVGLVYALSLSAPGPDQVGVGGSPTSVARASATPGSTDAMKPPSPAGTPSPADLENARLQAMEAVNSDPANFAGVLVAEDGSLVILYVAPNAGRQRVEGSIAPGLTVAWRQVNRSYDDLMRILREVRDRDLDGVVALSIDVAYNRVEVRVSPADRVSSVSSALASEYGDAVLVVGGPPIIVH